ncbi:MAG: hypothetical protein DMF61_07810 [Blastocatellia bacterium AA13]|nr:MAG: hypothetical protein DMF61_07810 [Blastocatellia bacterium AA13]
MIKVNLLEGTAEQRVTIQKIKVSAKRGQLIFMLGAALLIFGIAVGIDHLWTNNQLAKAETDLNREKEDAKKLEGDIQRKNDLESELKQVEDRIKVIKQLRAEQKGPVGMLSAINERVPGGTTDFQLKAITQKGNRLTIVGNAPDQQTVATFVQKLEFSNGMFTNLTFFLEGKDEVAAAASKDGKKAETDEIARMFHFKIDCDYNKPHDASADESKPADKPQTTQGK